MARDGSQVRRSNRVLNYLAIREEARAFAQVVGMRSVEWSLLDGGTPVPIAVGFVSPGAFGLLGVQPAAGRVFAPDEEQAGLDANVVVLSHSLWQRQFGGRPDVVGRVLRVEDRMATVIGVLGPGFRFPYDVEAWMPERVDPAIEASLAVFARLAPGLAPAQAQAELDAIAARAEAIRPVVNRGVRFAMTPIRESLVGESARTSLALMGAAVLLLVLASANVANLLLARGIRRAKEIAVRAALGAERSRQVQQMLVESLVFAAFGTALGLGVAHPLSTLLVGLVPNTLRDQLGLTDTTVDMRAAFFAAAITATAGVLAGLLPALKLARADVSDTLRQHTRGASSSHRVMRALVVGEVALASVLLVSAGLMVDNLQRLLNANLGLRAESLYAIELPLPPRVDTAERRVQLVRQLHEAAGAIPGVERAGLTSWNPLDRGSFGASIETEDAAAGARAERPHHQPPVGHAGVDDHRRGDADARDVTSPPPMAPPARRSRSSAAASPIGCGPASRRWASGCARPGRRIRGSPWWGWPMTCATPAPGPRRGTCRTNSTPARCRAPPCT